MIRFVSNIPISRRLSLFFAIAALIPAIVIFILGNTYISSLTVRGQAVQTSFDAQNLASNQLVNLQRMNALVQTRFNEIFASLSGKITDPSLANAGGLVSADIAAREADFQQTLVDYQANYDLATSSNMNTVRSILINDNPSVEPRIIGDQHQSLNAVVSSNWPAYQKLQKQEMTLLDSLDPTLPNHPAELPMNVLSAKYNQAYTILWHANFLFTDLDNNWGRVADDAAAIGKTVTAIGPSVTQPVLLSTIVALGSTILIVLATGWLVNLTITSPLRSLALLTQRITKGETHVRARVKSHDEIGLVTMSMNNMLDNIVRLIQEVQAQRDSLQLQVEKLVSEVSGVGEGDLRIQAEVTGDALGVLADSFNYMVEELSSLIIRVKQVASEVQNYTSLTFEYMTQVVEVADTHIYQITKAAMEVERMANASRQTSDRAQILYHSTHEVRQAAQGGREAVSQTAEGIGRIHKNVQNTANKVQTLSERSHEINNIVEVIATVAHQTNRLALDAAIQAAMAGENGKGFAAVAADIRRLAERAKEEVKTIVHIVRSIREDIGSVAVSMRDTQLETSLGADLAQETEKSLQRIFGLIERQAQEIETINQVAMQQLESSSNIVQVMQSVSHSTQQSSQSTHEASQNMEYLTRLTEQLLASVEAFKLHNNGNPTPPHSNVTGVLKDVEDNALTISSVLRVITSGRQSGNGDMHNALPASSASSQNYPYLPYQPENGRQ